jgi:hypothetical protein
LPIGLQLVPDDDALCELVRSATKCVDICSPFITREGACVVLTPGVPMRIITKVTGANLSTKALDSEALLEIMAHGGLIRSIANLHAKIYICDGRAGVITSSNLTGPGPTAMLRWEFTSVTSQTCLLRSKLYLAHSGRKRCL